MELSREKISISVIIPTYNRKDILEKCLDGFSQQTLPKENFEILVVDDGSTDGTGELLKETAARMPNLRYFAQPHGGPAKARNLAISKATGGILLFTNDDCVPDSKLLESHLKHHGSRHGIAVLGYVEWHPDLEVTPFMRYVLDGTQFNYPEVEKSPANVSFGHFYTSNISIEKSIVVQSGPFDETFPDAVFEDIELGYRITRCGVQIIFAREALTYHYHTLNFRDYLSRKIKLGKSAVIFYRKHPELAEFLGIHKAASAEARLRYYDSVMNYYQLMGIRQELENTAEDPEQLIPMEDRLKSWASAEQYSLSAKLLAKENEMSERCRDIDRLNKELAAAHARIAEIHAELDRARASIDELNRKNMEKHYRIVELEKFELRVKSIIPYKIYSSLKRLFR